MKRMYFVIIGVFVMLFAFYNVDALRSNSKELINRNVCDVFEVAIANSNDSITSIGCFSSYNDAKNAMSNHESDNAIILEKINGKFKVIDAKYALLYLDRGEVVTNVYTANNLKSAYTYMNNASAYGGSDAAFIELNYANKAVKMRISGVTGWISNGTYTIIPLSWVKSSGYYYNGANSVSHYYAKNIENSGYSQFSRELGPKIDSLKANTKYYSYDGVYFYETQKQMLFDYKNSTFENSVNYLKPYYNYYLYLPHRSKTNYTVDDVDTYLRNVLNYTGSNYGRQSLSKHSVLYGQSDFYFNAEKIYGANALSVFSLSRNESANGTSSIAINKNNIFGHNAVDGSAYNSASGYLDVRSSIYTHAYGFINYGYSEVSDSRYYGGHFGNKNTGMNVKYASDPYWGEKAANFYYKFDLDNGMIDYNYYQIGITNNTNINARGAPNTKSSIPYVYKYKGLPLIILEKVEGTVVNGSNIWYKVQADSNLNNANTSVVSANSNWPHYNWNSSVYIHSSFVDLINDSKKENELFNKPNDNNLDVVDRYTYKTFANSSSYNPIVGLLKENKDYFYTSSLINKKGTALKDSYVTILEEASDNDDVRYLIITDYSKYQKAWIDGKNVEIVSKDLLGFISTTSKAKVDIYKTINGEDIGDIYANNYLPIFDKQDVAGDIWVRVQFTINPISYGYIKIGDNMSYTFNHLNTKPEIKANDRNIYLNESINLLENVSAFDKEDGDLTNKIIVSGTVNNKKTGSYSISYSVTDSYGETITKTIKVNVIEYKSGSPLFMYNNLEHKKDNIFEVSGFLGIKGMDNKEVEHVLSFKNEITKDIYRFKLNNWKEYPYEMSSLDDDKTYNYSGGWFLSQIDLGGLPSGDYVLMITALNGDYETTTLFTNIAYANMTRRATNDNRGYAVEIDYTTSGTPLIFSVRENGLLSKTVPKTTDPMYNFFTEFNLINDELELKGTSHNVGVDFGINKNVKRELIFENINNFERYSFDIGSITNGDYKITLAVSDNCDKTRAWFNKKINLDSIPVGNYIIYIKNTIDDKSYHGELIDIAYTDFSKINNSKYKFNRNDTTRLRVELVKE